MSRWRRPIADTVIYQDELAEGQVPDAGYCGVNYEIDMESYEFDLFEYYDDLEYGDDSYWEYGLPGSNKPGEKRKRGVAPANAGHGKRRKANDGEQLVGEWEPLMFRSREERLRTYKEDAPLLKGKSSVSFMADWRERFADEDGKVTITKMPAAMRKAAEGQNDDTPPKARQLGEEAYVEDGEDGEEGWEDEEDDGDEEGGIGIDPEMLKSILREKLGAAGLDGMDESVFMQTIQKMMSGEGDDDDAAGDLANSLLGKLTSGTGNDGLSGWLSQQGVSLEDDDASSVATAEVGESTKGPNTSQTTLQTSPTDSVVETKSSKTGSNQMALHSGSPATSTKKRSAPDADNVPTKKHKKVQFDVPSQNVSGQEEDPAMPEPTVTGKTTRASSATTEQSNGETANETSHKNETTRKESRKRKASSANEKPAGKKTKMRELQDLGPLPEASSPAPPAKRTRSARAKGGK